MTDNHTKEDRSKNMALIKSKDTKPEIIVRSFLFSKGLRFRKNVRSLPGCPDIVLKKYNTVIFVNGCFWHHHSCGYFKWPKSNSEYWEKKINRNVERDLQNYETLKDMGWRVFVVWECQLKKTVADETLQQLLDNIIH